MTPTVDDRAQHAVTQYGQGDGVPLSWRDRMTVWAVILVIWLVLLSVGELLLLLTAPTSGQVLDNREVTYQAQALTCYGLVVAHAPLPPLCNDSNVRRYMPPGP